jgi:hypothetical protein
MGKKVSSSHHHISDQMDELIASLHRPSWIDELHSIQQQQQQQLKQQSQKKKKKKQQTGKKKK